jgi:alkanesulfonate monooxygenase SsuD/methylene tetrahydromethanopterin reductase-like flavin-dependent oxidoreductase (luciferase family)
MHFAYFTERPYRGLSEDEVLRHGAFFGMPNARFDRALASDDFNYYLDQAQYAEAVGFDGVALNEHHGTPFCMGAVVNMEAAVLARVTERARIYLIGNPIPVHRNPLRLAEELAEIDLISRGRLVAGWVRGSGPEQFFNNVNPAVNRELFQEAHDFIVQAWTRPGPWRYEGKHYHYRHINPWVLPYQQPFPPTIIPGVLSPETIEWASDHCYPYVGLATALGPTAELWDIYADRLAERGLQAGPENFGYVCHIHVADTQERAQTIGQNYLFANGNGNFAHAAYTLPAGFNSAAAIRRLSRQRGHGWLGVSRSKLYGAAAPNEGDIDEQKKKIRDQWVDNQQQLTMIAGTPAQVIEKVKLVMRLLRPGLLFVSGPFGVVPHEDRLRSLTLLGAEVLPELRAYAKELDLPSMFDRAPGSVAIPPGESRKPVVDRDALVDVEAFREWNPLARTA